MRNRHPFVLVMALCAALFALPALAAEHDHARGERGPSGGPQGHFDARYQHDHYYPARGYTTRTLPHGAYSVAYGGGNYWYHGGVWYRPYGPRWVVVAPPFGVYVPFLPPFYTTVWFGGVPYYYSNDAYYVWREEQQSYEVVEPPGGATASTDPPAPADVFMYPRNGQSAEDQARDRYECHRWAADQTGFDPTRTSGGVADADARAKRGEYLRAMTACLEGRGYSVK